MNRIFLLPVLLSVFAFSCSQLPERIVNETDYVRYLQSEIINSGRKKNADEIKFWQQRLAKDTGSYVNMLELAANYLQRFRLTGEINLLLSGDSLLKRSSAKLRNTDADILFALSQNSITQHQFAQAASYNEEAVKANGDPYKIRLLQFDTWMELGRYADAQKALSSLKDKTAFDYLIRKAKWEDHKGNLNEAIRLMEQAFEKVKNKKKSLYCWALSNLADMYGHAGRIKESYKAYLDVLKKDPANLYCLKGIAWITYSHDGNTAAAKRIVQYILSQTSMPELKLILAEIAESENKSEEKNKWVNEFLADVQQPGYGDMYNKYIIEICNEERQPGKAISLAEKELKNRFTPETCDWLAWTYYNNGDKKKALEYAKAYVYKRTFEPEALMHTAFIYADNGKIKEAEKMLKECLESSFELGPVTTRQIKKKLQSL
jgi:predicted Zn-dependent protease